MINKKDDDTNTPLYGALTSKEKEDLMLSNFGALRSEIHSLTKQITLIKKLERNILFVLLGAIAVALVLGVFIYSLV